MECIWSGNHGEKNQIGIGIDPSVNRCARAVVYEWLMKGHTPTHNPFSSVALSLLEGRSTEIHNLAIRISLWKEFPDVPAKVRRRWSCQDPNTRLETYQSSASPNRQLKTSDHWCGGSKFRKRRSSWKATCCKHPPSIRENWAVSWTHHDWPEVNMHYLLSV